MKVGQGDETKRGAEIGSWRSLVPTACQEQHLFCLHFCACSTVTVRNLLIARRLGIADFDNGCARLCAIYFPWFNGTFCIRNRMECPFDGRVRPCLDLLINLVCSANYSVDILVPPRPFSPSMAHYDIFRDQLGIKYPAFGHALWEPNPGRLYSPVEVGDVGFIREGKFHRLFNALLPADHPSHRRSGYQSITNHFFLA